MSQKKRTDKNSTSAALSGFAGAIDDVPLPDGISLRSEEEHVIWNQSTRARARRLAGYGLIRTFLDSEVLRSHPVYKDICSW